MLRGEGARESCIMRSSIVLGLIFIKQQQVDQIKEEEVGGSSG
jgi:hypothetical protein